MFGKMGSMFKNLGKMKKMMKDENFQNFMKHPEVQKLMTDKDFQNAVKSKNYMKLMSNKKLLDLMKNPDIKDALGKLDMKSFQ